MNNIILEYIINKKLNSQMIKDHVPNGLQVEGRSEVRNIVTGVTACQALLDKALIYKADAIIVHHGYFWKNESRTISGMKRRRLKTLLANDINLYAWHLPLDIHPILGNNAQLALALKIRITRTLESLLFQGELATWLSGNDLKYRLEQLLGRSVFHYGENGPDQILRLAWCTGSGQGFIETAAKLGVDAFITGEISEQTIHIAREYGLHFYAAGHHATERSGIIALGTWLNKKHKLDINFIDIPNPA